MSITKLVVGLGNPGTKYELTRHNLGFLAVEALAKDLGAGFRKCRYASAMIAEAGEPGQRIIIAQPQTFMNNSGQAVGEIVRFDKVENMDIIIVCDDIHIPFGEMRLRLEGSDGGHNGLTSVIEHLGTQKFARLRMGVGEPASGQVDHVLSEFTKTERALLPGFIEDAVKCLKLWLNGETAQAMTQYNKRKGND